MNVIPETRDMH